MSNLVNLARNVAKAQEHLDRALEALWAATGRPTKTRPTGAPKVKSSGGLSISQTVLDRATREGGATRADLIRDLGHPDAVSSALKKHRAAGRIAPAGGGRWVSAAETSTSRPPGTPPAAPAKKKGARS